MTVEDTASTSKQKRLASDAQSASPKLSKTEKVKRSLMQTMPFVMASSLAISMNLSSATSAPDLGSGAENRDKPKDVKNATIKPINRADASPDSSNADYSLDASISQTTLASMPASYVVKKGDTVSAIAKKFGLSTATLLAKNGLGWSTLIFPGQVLTLTSSNTKTPITPSGASQASRSESNYKIKAGDTVSKIAKKHGVSTQSILDANGLSWQSIIYPGQTLRILFTSSTPVTPAPVTNSKPEANAPSAAVSGKYTIVAGDTVSKIAKKFGLTTQALLNANNLKMTSTIYTGRTLIIPGTETAAASTKTQKIVEMTYEMRKNAQTIINVGRDQGVPEYGLVIALATAMQESGLQNLNYGDRDSIGLFQQRPSTGWGTVAEIMDPIRSAKAFFGGSGNPNPGQTRGLLDIPGWQLLTLTQAAQAVQLSGFPDAYAKWEASARYWLTQLN